MTPTRKGDDPYNRAVGDILRAQKARIRMTEASLSEVSGVAVAQISRLFNAKAMFDMRELISLASALGLDPGDVVREARETAQKTSE
jgi:transcriptional regulator with XRE-family HTH domain